MSGGEQQMLAIGPRADGAARSCCCSTSRRWASRRCSSSGSTRRSRRSTSRARRSCWSSRTRTSRSSVSKRALRARDRHGRARRRVREAAREPRSAEGVPGRMTELVTRRTSAPRRSTSPSPGSRSAIVASWLSDRKGYGERPGLAAGLLLSAVGVVIWLVWPAQADSRWKVQGAIPRRGQQQTVAEARAEHDTPGPPSGAGRGRPARGSCLRQIPSFRSSPLRLRRCDGDRYRSRLAPLARLSHFSPPVERRK